MIKALSKTKDGRLLVLLGLSRTNIQRSLQDQPIYVDMQEPLPKGFGIEGGHVIAILGGESESSISDQLKAAGLKLPDEVHGEAAEPPPMDLQLEKEELVAELRMVVERLGRMDARSFEGPVQVGKQRWKFVMERLEGEDQSAPAAVPQTHDVQQSQLGALFMKPVEKVINDYFHCRGCMTGKPRKLSPKAWSNLEVGFTSKGLQVWCSRCNASVISLDFRGQKVGVGA